MSDSPSEHADQEQGQVIRKEIDAVFAAAERDIAVLRSKAADIARRALRVGLAKDL
jgi:hypothetical protein